MDNRLDKLENKIDSIMNEQTKLTLATVENTMSLKDHMLQTIEVRKQTELLKDTCVKIVADIDERFKEKEPYFRFIDTAKMILSWLGYILLIVLTSDKLGVLDFIFKIK
jgi:hypothetical protein